MHREPQPVKLYTTRRCTATAARRRAATASTGSSRRGDRLGRSRVDAEVIQLYDELLRRLGVTDYELELNSIGDRNCRPAYVERLDAWLDEHDGRLDDEARAKRATSPLRVFDVKTRSVREALADAPKIGDSLCDDCREHFAAVRATSTPTASVRRSCRRSCAASTTTRARPSSSSARGAARRSTICGGGRYDGLIEEIGGPPTPGIGFGAGIERLLLALASRRTPSRSSSTSSSSSPTRAAARGARELASCARRRLGDADYAGRSMKGSSRRRARSARAASSSRRRRRQRGDADGRCLERSRYGSDDEWRDLRCGEVRPSTSATLTLAGWAARGATTAARLRRPARPRRVCQLVVNPERAPRRDASRTRSATSSCSSASGDVVARAPEASTRTSDRRGRAPGRRARDRLALEPLPFQLDEENVDETLRLRYRWLDLRRDRMQRNIRLRAQMVAAIRRRWTRRLRRHLDADPAKPTPEGARDFLVPAGCSRAASSRCRSRRRSQAALMIAGFDRYYQIAICFRDEDLRADRQFEFRSSTSSWRSRPRGRLRRLRSGRRVVRGARREPTARRSALTYARRCALRHDKPDLRFGLEIEDATEVTRGSGFGVFAERAVRPLPRVPQELSRAELAALEDVAKEWGAKGLAYLVYDEEGEVRSPIAKFLSESELAAFRAEPARPCSSAPTSPMVARVLGALRSHLGDELGLIDERADEFLWVLDFPLFERTKTSALDVRPPPVHRPLPGHEELIESDPARGAATPTTSSGTAGSSARARSGSTAGRAAARLRALGMSDEERRRSSASCSRRCGWAPAARRLRHGIERLRRAAGGRARHPEVSPSRRSRAAPTR
jgi:aspartyl-tRNA synthetase